MVEIWDEFEHDPRRPEHSALRAADRDRDVARQALGNAYAEGRLDRDELDSRTDEVLAARTLGELPTLINDLIPSAGPSHAPDVRHEQAVAEHRKDRKEALWTFLSVSVLCWVIWFATSWNHGNLDPYFPWPLFPMLGTGINLGRLIFMRDEMIANNERRLERKELKEFEKKERSLEKGRSLETERRRELDPPE